MLLLIFVYGIEKQSAVNFDSSLKHLLCICETRSTKHLNIFESTFYAADQAKIFATRDKLKENLRL